MNRQSDADLKQHFSGILRAFLALFCNYAPTEAWDSHGHVEPRFGGLPKYAVLVVDDDVEFLNATQRQLSEAGFDVLKACSVAQGLDLLRSSSTPMDVLVLAYDTPTGDGAQALGHVRAVQPKLHIIGVTSVDLRSVPESFREGVHKLLSKSLQCSDLIASIRKLLEDRLGVSQSATAPSRDSIRSG